MRLDANSAAWLDLAVKRIIGHLHVLMSVPADQSETTDAPASANKRSAAPRGNRHDVMCLVPSERRECEGGKREAFYFLSRTLDAIYVCTIRKTSGRFAGRLARTTARPQTARSRVANTGWTCVCVLGDVSPCRGWRKVNMGFGNTTWLLC